VWQDNAAAAGLEQTLQAHRDAEEARWQARRKASGLCEAIGQQWSHDARETARQQFIADYGDESLWPDHSASMRFDCPHTGFRGGEKPWEQAVGHLVRGGADLAGVTVAEMARLYTARTGHTLTVPEDIAHYRFPGTSDSHAAPPPGNSP